MDHDHLYQDKKDQHNIVVRWLYLVGGLIALSLGIIGAFLPIMPTVVFLLLALFCFSRSSPKLEAWILNHSVLGPLVHDWRAHGVITKRSKIIAVSMISVSYFILTMLTNAPFYVKIGVGVILACVIIFILSRPSKPKIE